MFWCCSSILLRAVLGRNYNRKKTAWARAVRMHCWRVGDAWAWLIKQRGCRHTAALACNMCFALVLLGVDVCIYTNDVRGKTWRSVQMPLRGRIWNGFTGSNTEMLTSKLFNSILAQLCSIRFSVFTGSVLWHSKRAKKDPTEELTTLPQAP